MLAQTAWVLAENLDTGGDWFLALDQPWNGMSLMVESSSRASTSSPQSVVNVWGRSDPIVVSGALARVRERAAGRGVQVRAYPEVRMIEYSLWTRPNSVRAWSNRSQLRMSDNL